MAPGEGFEPPTQRLTAACSTTELPGIGLRRRRRPYNRAARTAPPSRHGGTEGRKRNRIAVRGFAIRAGCLLALSQIITSPCAAAVFKANRAVQDLAFIPAILGMVGQGLHRTIDRCAAPRT
jgi:hypothetical protein